MSIYTHLSLDLMDSSQVPQLAHALGVRNVGTVDSALLALGKLTATGEIGQPSRYVNAPCVYHSHDRPQFGFEMTQMLPDTGLTHRGFQGIVERGVFVHSILGG